MSVPHAYVRMHLVGRNAGYAANTYYLENDKCQLNDANGGHVCTMGIIGHTCDIRVPAGKALHFRFESNGVAGAEMRNTGTVLGTENCISQVAFVPEADKSYLVEQTYESFGCAISVHAMKYDGSTTADEVPQTVEKPCQSMK